MDGSVNKAIAAGFATLVTAILAKYGLHPSVVVNNALGVLETALVGYVVGHVLVYISPKNQPKA